MSYIYHYSAVYQREPGSMDYMDGILTCDSRIQSMERLKEVKDIIASIDEGNGVYYDPKKLIVTSLSFLHHI